MTTSPVLLIVESSRPDAGLSRSLSSIDWMLALGSRTVANASCKAPVACLGASPIRDSAHRTRPNNPIQTP